MIRLALETSTSLGSVAVGGPDRLLGEMTLGEQTRHAEMVLPAADALLRQVGVDREAIEEVVVGGGPGSFTGVRVAGATAKGLVASLGVPLRSYSSLLALAAGVPSDRPVCALFDARRGEVYAGCWRVGVAGIQELLAPTVAPVDEVLAATRPVAPLFAGDGAVRYRADLEAGGGVVAEVPAYPRASTLLWLAHHHPAAGAVDDAAVWEPVYIRGSSAERGVDG